MARKPKLDETLAAAHERARAALLEIAPESMIGAHLDAVCDGDRLVTHRFVTLQPGYEGWCWFATLTRIPRAQAKDITVCEVGILPGEDALLAPAWVPWAERVRPEDLEAERLASEEAAGQGEVGAEEPETHDDSDEAVAEGSGDPDEGLAEDKEADGESPEGN
ncbi:DUF3027 domain-containing protein [Paeniglutamicibacter sp. R2-26]|uniref:DUF3027 domain-containing protein n=1 Tax=Paeniglutamicibacter sp. R2-26 TaxID=3144417 RepID=UPI003EE5310F